MAAPVDKSRAPKCSPLLPPSTTAVPRAATAKAYPGTNLFPSTTRTRDLKATAVAWHSGGAGGTAQIDSSLLVSWITSQAPASHGERSTLEIRAGGVVSLEMSARNVAESYFVVRVCVDNDGFGSSRHLDLGRLSSMATELQL
jgi:hypothetical protein